MKFNKNNLLDIKSLDLYSIIGSMSENDYENYCAALDKFAESLPNKEMLLKGYFKANDYNGLEKCIKSMRDEFYLIYAGDLVRLCDKLYSDIKNPKREMAEACLTYFLTNVSMLSIEIQMAKHKAADETPLPVAIVNTGPKTILAVDDVSLLLSTLRSFLQNTEYKFVGVTSGESALKYLQNHKADLFLLDIEMPGMNGYELAIKLKESGQTAPIIFLTGNAQTECVRRAIEVGASEFIVKPVNGEQVLEKIRKFIK